MNEELLDVVNEQDEVIGQSPRREVHARKLWHRAVHVLVFNARGEVFLQKRSLAKDTAAGLWDSSASGHLDAGEEYDACAARELREEIGLDLGKIPHTQRCKDAKSKSFSANPAPLRETTTASGPLEKLFKIAAGAETGWEFAWVYRCASEGPFTLHPDEIETGAWFAPESVTQWLAERPQEFASAFVLIWGKMNAETQNP